MAFFLRSIGHLLRSIFLSPTKIRDRRQWTSKSWRYFLHSFLTLVQSRVGIEGSDSHRFVLSALCYAINVISNGFCTSCDTRTLTIDAGQPQCCRGGMIMLFLLGALCESSSPSPGPSSLPSSCFVSILQVLQLHTSHPPAPSLNDVHHSTQLFIRPWGVDHDEPSWHAPSTC